MSNEWILIGHLDESDCNLKKYNKTIGIYKALLNNEIVYIGKATEYNNGGFRKRLRDYTRENDSARLNNAGKNMNLYANEIIIEILIVESNEKGVKKANSLEKELIEKYKPKWNKL